MSQAVVESKNEQKIIDPDKERPGPKYIFETPQELENAVNEYTEYCKEEEKIFTVTGLAAHLGVDRKTIYNYNKRQGFSTALKHAILKAEATLEQHLLKGKNQVGAMFALKNHFGWKDKKQVDVNKNETITHVMSELESGDDDVIDGEIEE